MAKTFNSISYGVKAAKSVILTTLIITGAAGAASVYFNSRLVVHEISPEAATNPLITLQVEALKKII